MALFPLQVVSSLYRRHAWVVTGTPISSSLAELAGLCEFLAYHPYCDAGVWKHLVHAPYSSRHAMGVTALRWGLTTGGAWCHVVWSCASWCQVVLHARVLARRQSSTARLATPPPCVARCTCRDVPPSFHQQQPANNVYTPIHNACMPGCTARETDGRTLLRGVMLRRSKAAVEAQLALPPCARIDMPVQLSGVERTFYDVLKVRGGTAVCRCRAVWVLGCSCMRAGYHKATGAPRKPYVLLRRAQGARKGRSKQQCVWQSKDVISGLPQCACRAPRVGSPMAPASSCAPQRLRVCMAVVLLRLGTTRRGVRQD